MSRILSQDEIHALLASAREAQRRAASRQVHAAVDAPIYNFRRPDRVPKDRVQAIHLLHERFARNLGTALSVFLRTSIEVSLVSVDQFTYAEVLKGLPDPTAFYAIRMPPLDGLGALELHPAVAIAMVNWMLGGRGAPVEATRALTEIEQDVVDSVVALILDNLAETWRPQVEVHLEIQARETHPQMLKVATPTEAMLLLAFQIKLGELRGAMHLCLPASGVSCFVQGYHGGRREPTPAESRRLARNLARVRAPLTAEIATGVAARDIVTLEPGDIISLGRPVHEPVPVRVWQSTRFLARPVRTLSGRGLEITTSLAADSEATL